MIVILDTRNQKDSFVQEALEKLGCKILRSKLPFGDVALSSNILNCIDLKSSSGGLLELSKNRCSRDHNRMKAEIENCISCGGNITFMCFEPGMTKIDDIASWKVPTFKGDLYKKIVKEDGSVERVLLHKKGQPMTKVNPETLMKSIKTMTSQDHYRKGFKVNFEFATKQNCGEKILKILQGEKSNGNN